jgi:DNA-binding transcriptional LysR family regulator
MELRHLRYFVAVAEERHFTRAAERLGIGQPPLSQQIQQLERELGARLFRRLSRGVELTEVGQVFLGDARATLAAAEQALINARRAARGEFGTLHIGFTVSASFHPFLPQVILQFRESHPEITLTLREGNSSEMLADVRDGRLDLALVRPPSRQFEQLEIEPLFDEDMLIVLSERHPLSTRASLTLAELAGEDFVLYARQTGPGVFDAIVAACRAAGFSPNVTQEAPQMSSTINLVAAGLGVSIVPAAIRSFRAQGVRYLPITGIAPRAPLSLAYRRFERAGTVQRFLAALRLAAGLAPEVDAPANAPPIP